MKNDVDKLSQFLVFLIIFIVLLAVRSYHPSLRQSSC